jgi:dCMP deaminase
MNLALMLASRSTCSRLHVGCVVVSEDNQRVLAIGYNGSWKGGPNGCDSGEPGNCGCLHAEDNALIKLNYNEPANKKLYTTIMPCAYCAKRIVNAGVKEVIYLHEYRKKEGIEILAEAGVKVRQIPLGDVQLHQDGK